LLQHWFDWSTMVASLSIKNNHINQLSLSLSFSPMKLLYGWQHSFSFRNRSQNKKHSSTKSWRLPADIRPITGITLLNTGWWINMQMQTLYLNFITVLKYHICYNHSFCSLHLSLFLTPGVMRQLLAYSGSQLRIWVTLIYAEAIYQRWPNVRQFHQTFGN